jgi:hypothetical protein
VIAAKGAEELLHISLANLIITSSHIQQIQMSVIDSTWPEKKMQLFFS